MHHLNTCAAHCIPAKAGAATSPPIREVSTHSNPSTSLPVHHDHNPSLPPRLNASHSRIPRIVAEVSPSKALAATNIIDPDDDKLFYFCGMYDSDYLVGMRRGGSILRVSGSIQRRNLLVCESSRLGSKGFECWKKASGGSVENRIFSSSPCFYFAKLRLIAF